MKFISKEELDLDKRLLFESAINYERERILKIINKLQVKYNPLSDYSDVLDELIKEIKV